MANSDVDTHGTADSPPTQPGGGLTRRQLLVAATAGGAALAATALGAAEVSSLATKAPYELELAKLRTLLALYEQLDRVGLDALLTTGMNVVRGGFDALKSSVRLIRDGITAVENALTAFQTALDSLSKSADGARGVLADLGDKFHAAESVVISVLGTALPLTESIRGFFNALIEKIPFGIGDNIRRAVDALVNLIRAIPTAIDSLTNQFLKPLSDMLFPASGDAAVKTNLFDPIKTNLLDPLRQFLTDVESLIDQWEKDLATPVNSALQQRQQIRQQIASYRKENNI